MAKLTLKDYLLNQAIPVQMINKLVQFRKLHGKPEDDSRVRSPQTMFVDAYKDSHGKIVSKGILRKALGAILAGDNLLLVGPKGSGKNTLADTIAFLLNRPQFEVAMHVHADAEALMGKDTFKAVPVEREVIVGVDGKGAPIRATVVERQGEVMFSIAQFAEAMKVGGVAVLDEINMGRPEAEAVLHPVLDDRRRIDIPGYGLLHVHPAARVIATMNHGYAGTQELNEALADRLVPIEVPPMTADEITVFFESRFPGIMGEFAKQLALLFHDMLGKAESQELQTRAVTFRGLMQAVRLVSVGITPHEAVTTCVSGRTFDSYEKSLLQTLVDSRIPKSWTCEAAYTEATEAE